MKKVIALLVLYFMIILVSGCNGGINRNNIYDDDEKIAKSTDNHYSYMSVYTLKDNELFMTARTFSGAKTIWRYTAKNDGDITFSYSLSVSDGGKAKLVLITPDNEVITLIENTDSVETDEVQFQTVSINKGSNRIKIVGYDNPGINLVLCADVGDLVNK